MEVASPPATRGRSWTAPLRALRERRAWVWLHRWAGLVMTIFLVITGLTGSLLAFYDELDVLVNPRTHRVTPPYPDAPMLDMATLRERALVQRPEVWTDSALAPWQPGRSLSLWVTARDTGTSHPPTDDELFVDPYTGEVLGGRRWGDLSQGAINLMPFIYRLHRALALEPVGTYLLGIIALIWTLDCFLGAYLTLPRGRPFFSKWRPAWGIKPRRLNYDLHRASGLWTWAMLFVLAWSSVAFNLQEVYYPVTKAVFGLAEHEEHHHHEHEIEPQRPEPGLPWNEAYALGKRLMQQAVHEHGIGVHREDALRFDDHENELTFWIATKFNNGDAAYDWFGVVLDADTGALLRIDGENIGTGTEKTGDVVTRWLLDLHMASIWGMPWRIFVCLMGVVVTTLSVTGVVIWWRKRRATGGKPARKAGPA